MTKSILKNTLLATLLLSTTNLAMASESIFKVAVVKGAIGTVDITKGEFESSIKKVTSNKTYKEFYTSKMNLCVAYLQLNDNTKSEPACTAAIESLEEMSKSNKGGKYLTALNYSNRGVAKYRKNQLTAALKDFETAVAIDNNSITKSNLVNMRLQLAETPMDNMSELSD